MEDLRVSAESIVGLEELQGKAVLVTGASGTIGSFLVDVLLYCNRENHMHIRIYAAGRNVERLASRFDGMRTDELQFVSYDAGEPLSFEIQMDYIIHAAGKAFPAAFNRDPVGTITENVGGTFRLLEYGRSHGAKRLLYVSSGEVYGQGDLSLDSFDESYCGYLDTTAPRSCYPQSKRLVETLCASYTKQYGFETVIVRPCHTYGPWMTDQDNRANVQFVRNVLRGEDITLNSPGTQMRSYCYVADCVSAILTVLLKGKSGEAYNSANHDARITIAGFARVVAEAANRQVIFADPNAEDLANRTPIAKQVLSTDKVEALGWHGKYPVDTGVRHVLAVLQDSH